MVSIWLFSMFVGQFLKEDLIKVFRVFFCSGRIPTSMNSTFIIFVPLMERSIKVCILGLLVWCLVLLDNH